MNLPMQWIRTGFSEAFEEQWASVLTFDIFRGAGGGDRLEGRGDGGGKWIRT